MTAGGRFNTRAARVSPYTPRRLDDLWRSQLPRAARPAAYALGRELDRVPAVPCSLDPDGWYSDDPDDRAVAAILCSDCAIAPECLAYAIQAAERHGVWGGVDMTEQLKENRSA